MEVYVASQKKRLGHDGCYRCTEEIERRLEKVSPKLRCNTREAR